MRSQHHECVFVNLNAQVEKHFDKRERIFKSSSSKIFNLDICKELELNFMMKLWWDAVKLKNKCAVTKNEILRCPFEATSIFCLHLSSNWLSNLAVISHPRCSLWSQEPHSTFTPWVCSGVPLKNKCMHLKHIYPSFSRTISIITLKTYSNWELTHKILNSLMSFFHVLDPIAISLSWAAVLHIYK